MEATMLKTNTKFFREHLKRFILENQPTVIGDGYHTRAVLIPFSELPTWDRPAMKKALATFNKTFRALERDLRKDLC
jgi:hypothetical protein